MSVLGNKKLDIFFLGITIVLYLSDGNYTKLFRPFDLDLVLSLQLAAIRIHDTQSIHESWFQFPPTMLSKESHTANEYMKDDIIELRRKTFCD